jgi:hypothetical protein
VGDRYDVVGTTSAGQPFRQQKVATQAFVEKHRDLNKKAKEEWTAFK